jgi:uncharacterized protein (TIGR02466 family)
MAEIRRMFSTPFALEMVDELVDLATLKQAIAEERERDPKGMPRSNIGGWHSAPTLQHWGGDAARALARRVAAIADGMTLDDRDRAATRHRWKADMWANVAGPGDARQYHFHPGCVWSAVAYCDDGYEGSADPALGGELVLLDPRMPQIRMNAPHLRLREGDGGEQLVEPFVRPRSGLLVVFPAGLAHAVRPFHGSGTRISVALNLSAD